MTGKSKLLLYECYFQKLKVRKKALSAAIYNGDWKGMDDETENIWMAEEVIAKRQIKILKKRIKKLKDKLLNL